MTAAGPDAAARIAREQALALHALDFDTGRRRLCITVDGTRVDDEEQQPDTGNPELDAVLGKSRAIVVRPGCRRYQITFEDVTTFMVHDESTHVHEPHEDFTTPLRTYTQSRFLAHLAQESFADQVMPDAPRHYRVATLDDIIDVASPDAPHVTSRVLMASDLWLPSGD